MQTTYPIGGYAPGNYQNKCCTCGELFIGDKRAVQCEPCATKMISDPNVQESDTTKAQ
jgi:DNA-directed RNA polymerase subunit RPC12/RpoP